MEFLLLLISQKEQKYLYEYQKSIYFKSILYYNIPLENDVFIFPEDHYT